MRKIILFLISLCTLAGIAQDSYEYRYWLDNESKPKFYTGSSASAQWDMEIDVSHVSPSIHTLHIQVKDTAGNWSSTVSRGFMKISPMDNSTLCYRVDEDTVTTIPIDNNAALMLDVSHLDDGLHSLYCYIINSAGVTSMSEYRYFMKVPQIDSQHLVTSYTYLDGELYEMRKFDASGGVIDLDINVDTIPVGMHRLSVQLALSNGMMSSTYDAYFYRGYTNEEMGATQCRCAIDGVVDSTRIYRMEDGAFLFDIDVRDLPVGLHKIEVQISNRYGALNTMYDAMFYRIPTDEEMAATQCHYYIDDRSDSIMTCPIDNGAFIFDMDVSDLSEGVHKFTFSLAGKNGFSTAPQTHYFIKQEGIRMYEYWLNNDYADRETITLESKQSSYSFISLLPVDVVPIRSELFHFEEMDGAPTVVAKNMFNVMFFYGKQMVRESKSYIDYNVSEVIDSLVDITHLTRHTTTVPAENEIKWYKFYSEEGDSVSFYTDKACTVHLFDSLGNELYQAQGIEALQANGTYTMHNGTYYIALHDVTQNGSNVTLHYMHLDKYAYLSHTPDKAGVEMGEIYVSLYGNGFNYMTSVKLCNNGGSIYSDTIAVSDNNNAIVRFAIDENNTRYGRYDMTLYFIDDNEVDSLIIADAITVEETIYGDIIIDVWSSGAYSNPHPVTVKIKNTGNVSYCYIPFNIAYEGTGDVKFEDFVITVSDDYHKLGGKISTVTDNLLGRGVKGTFIPMLIPILRPYEEIELTLNFMSTIANNTFRFYAWAGEPWSIEYKSLLEESVSRQNASAGYDYRSNMSSLDNVRGMCGLASKNAQTAVNLGRMIGNIQLGLGAATRQAQWEASGMSYEDWYEQVGQYMPQYRQLENPGDIMRGSIYDFLGKPSHGDYDDYNDGMDDQAEGDTPMPNPNNIHSHRSYDPNDILGYVSPSGTNYIGIEQQTISYTIEFENDSTMATASARQVLLCDTLDKEIFDLATLSPRYIIIGGRRIELDGVAPFVKTIDMRPEINTILQVELEYDSTEGVSRWIFSSLDPMTLQPVELMENGFLPINDENGRGQGSVTFDITLQPHLADGTIVENVADIIFDNNEAIVTPVWVNETDYVYPVSWVGNLEIVNDSTINVVMGGEDTRSGIWKYDLYVSTSVDNRWQPVATDIMEEGYIYHVEKDVEYSFCTVATDMAGNRELKDLAPEYYYVNGKVYSDVHYIEQDAANEDDNVYYDLRGIRVENPGPGIYVRKGKKVVIYRR